MEWAKRAGGDLFRLFGLCPFPALQLAVNGVTDEFGAAVRPSQIIYPVRNVLRQANKRRLRMDVGFERGASHAAFCSRYRISRQNMILSVIAY